MYLLRLCALELTFRLIERVTQVRLLFVRARDECAALRLLAKLLELFIDLVCRAARVVDDELCFLSCLRGSLFLLFLNLLIVFFGLLLLLFGLEPQLLGLKSCLLHLLALLLELGKNVLKVHVVLADHAARVL